MPIKKKGRSTISAVTPSQFISSKDITVGQPVIVLGFPGAIRSSLGPSFLTMPIARGGLISWIPSSENMPKAILIDSMVFPGNSGGPVFNLPKYWDEYGIPYKKPQSAGFLGIVIKSAIQPMDIKAIQVKSSSNKKFKPLSLDYMGLAQLEPGNVILELLDEVSKIIPKTNSSNEATE